MSHNKKITLLAALAMICIGFFLFYGLGNWEYSLPRRCFKVFAMMLTESDRIFNGHLPDDYK